MDEVAAAIGTVLGYAFLGFVAWGIGRAIYLSFKKPAFTWQGRPVEEWEYNALARRHRNKVNRESRENWGAEGYLIEPDPEELIHQYNNADLPLCGGYDPEGSFDRRYECHDCVVAIRRYIQEIDEAMHIMEVEANQGFSADRPTAEEARGAQDKGIRAADYAKQFRETWRAENRRRIEEMWREMEEEKKEGGR